MKPILQGACNAPEWPETVPAEMVYCVHPIDFFWETTTMSLPQQLEQELQQRAGRGPSGPVTIALTDLQGNQLEVQFQSLDSLGCAVHELSLTIPGLQGLTFDRLQSWATALSRKITYLLEQIGPLEFDSQANEALIRSTHPGQLPQGTVYYEFLLKPQAGRSLMLKRYQATAGQPGRQAVSMQLTHEVLIRLVSDLLDTAPAPP